MAILVTTLIPVIIELVGTDEISKVFIFSISVSERLQPACAPLSSTVYIFHDPAMHYDPVVLDPVINDVSAAYAEEENVKKRSKNRRENISFFIA